MAHDEDGDGIPDVSDNCPTVQNADQLNLMEIKNGEAADAVGDACDPDPIETGDTIAFFAPFTTSAGFDKAGTVMDVAGESIALGCDSAVLAQVAVSSPTLAVVQLAWTGSLTNGNLASVTVGSNMVTCGMQICGTGTCVYASTTSGGALLTGWGGTASDLLEIRFASTNHECDVESAQSTGTLANSYSFPPGKVGFATSGATSTFVLHNLIVYGH